MYSDAQDKLFFEPYVKGWFSKCNDCGWESKDFASHPGDLTTDECPECQSEYIIDLEMLDD